VQKKDDQVAAAAVLVRALLVEGKKDEASKEITKSLPIAAQSQNLSVQLAFAAVKARADAASGKPSSAISTLNPMLTKAKKAGYLGGELEIRLASEDVSKESHSVASRSRIEQLERDAKDKGFDLIARKAAAL